MVTDLFLVCADAQTLLFQICETNNLLLTQTISFKICVQMKKAFLLIEHVYFRFNTKAQIAFVVVCSESCESSTEIHGGLLLPTGQSPLCISMGIILLQPKQFQ